jgi:phosphoribosylaminoimidazolecarboxamide formyltransferase/IMP cyclohydrolase
MSGVFFEMVLAPDFDPDALKTLKRRRNRIIQIQDLETYASQIEIRQISGGALLQTPDVSEDIPSEWQVVTEKSPTDQQLKDLEFAWKACRHVKSNAIVLAKENMLIGMGAGQPNRVISVKLAVQSGGSKTSGSVMSSDAFFPFPDNIEVASKNGISSIIQPGGSIRDSEVIDAANDCGISMVFTGKRHFLH